MANEVYKNDTAITLDWADVSGANKYHLQVSQVPDFGDSLLVNDSTLAVSTKAFTDSGVTDGKRYWRWRYSSDAGVTWSAWQEVGSYWVNTSATGDVSLSSKAWAVFNASDQTDIFTLTTNPLYRIVPQLIPRIKDRNRLGTLVSEYITSKAFITLGFPDSAWMDLNQRNAFLRMNREVKTFFLACLKYNGQDYVPHIWKVQCSADPEMTMIAAGREDTFVGDIAMEEV